MLPFETIYKKAINLFDDPIIKRAYMEDTVRWEKLMYPHLMNGLKNFANPTKIAYLLIDQTNPDGDTVIFTTSSNSNTYTLTGSDIPDITSGVYTVFVDKRIDRGAQYDFDSHVITFSYEVPANTECKIDVYNSGCFNTDFKAAATRFISSDAIAYQVADILADALIIAWAENEENFLLDIKNVLTDTDFKIYAPANSIRAKCAWVDQLRFNFHTLITKLQWNLLSGKYTGGNYYV